MDDITIADAKKIIEFMRTSFGIESFVMYYNFGETFNYVFARPDAALMAYGITAATEKLGKPFAQLALDMAGEVPDEGPSEFIPDSEN